MKALTFWQPWATLIVCGAKPWEWRGEHTARLAAKLAGQRIGIHAGARRVKPSEIDDIMDRLKTGEASLIRDLAEQHLLGIRPESYPRSAILGTAVLGEPVPVEEWCRRYLKTGYDSDRFAHHKFAIPMREVERFLPIPATGARGFWNWSETVETLP